MSTAAQKGSKDRLGNREILSRRSSMRYLGLLSQLVALVDVVRVVVKPGRQR